MATSSPAGTRIPRDGASLVDGAGVTWTIQPDAQGVKWAFRDGMKTNGHAVAIDWNGTDIFVLSPTGARWWKVKLITVAWVQLTTVDPDPQIGSLYVPPVFSFPEPLSLTVGIPTSLASFVTSVLPLVFTTIDTPQASLTADGKLTQKVEGTISNLIAVNDGH